MKVPEEIRKVKRPVNTIVEDSGRDGPIMGKLSDISSILSLFRLIARLILR